jgi:N-acetylglutamate synthase-like GNAT family acetyltransferase
MVKTISTRILPAGVTLRQAGAEDIPEMIAVINSAFEAENFFVNRPRTHAAQLTEHLGNGHFLLAHDGGKLIASVYYELRGERGYIGMLAVRPDQQLRGLGRTMMHLAEQALRDAACSIAELTVVSVRTTLPPFYYKLGYVESGLAKVPEELQQKLSMPVELVRMEKLL